MLSNCFLREYTLHSLILIISPWKIWLPGNSKKSRVPWNSIVDANNCLNEIFPSFNSLNSKFQLGLKLIDIFSSCFSFYKADCYSDKSKIAYCNKLNELLFTISLEPNTVVVISDANTKNNVAISIVHIHFFNKSLKKMLHYAIDITSMEIELFAIRYRINQAIQISDSSCIIGTIYIAKEFLISLYIFINSNWLWYLRTFKSSLIIIWIIS